MAVHSFQSFLLEIPFSRILFKGFNRGFMIAFKNSLAYVKLVVVVRMSKVKATKLFTFLWYTIKSKTARVRLHFLYNLH